MKKFNFGKVFTVMATGAAVFALAFAGCDDLSDTLRRALDGELKKAEADNADSLKEAFTDPSVKVVEIKDDIDGAKLEKIIVPAGDKTIYIPGGKETSLGSLELSAGSHVKIVNADEGGTAKSVSAVLAIAYSEQNYEGWATLVIWDHFRIPDGATFDLVGRTRLVFRTAVVDGKLTAEIKDSILGAGEETPTITGGGKVQTGEVEKDAALAAADIKNSDGHKGPQGGSVPPKPITFAANDYVSETAADVAGWTDTNWTLTAGEHNKVYFAVNNPAGSTITVGGADAAKVTQAAAGESVAAVEGGLGATETLAVFTVDTGSLLFDGGSRSFTLGDVAVTVNVTPNLTGAAVFKVTWPEGKTYYDSAYTGGSYDSDGVFTGGTYNAEGAYSDQTLTRLDNTGELEAFASFLPAIEYVDRNAEENTEYLIRVEQDETSLPRIFLCGNNVENVTMRVRGYGEARVLKCSAVPGNTSNDSYNSINTKPNFPSNAGNKDYGFINIVNPKALSLQNKITLVLDDNITVNGSGESPATVYRAIVCVSNNGTLVLRKGALITKHNDSSESGKNSVIYVITGTKQIAPTPVLANDGKVRIEGGSVTKCTFETGTRLIYFNSKAEWNYTGSFYMGASTDDNPISFADNSNNELFFYNSSPAVNKNLSEFLNTGLRFPDSN
jgi:hypothetical protein